jgi:hypothetical protein
MAFASDYVDVAHRIAAFFDRYPDGSIQAEPPAIVEVGGKVYVACTASVYRTPDDPRPARASAWEPWPGTTNFTRDSEAMNCETSAVGRAIAFLGFEVKKGIATAQDVQRARERQPAKKAAAKKQPPERDMGTNTQSGDPIGGVIPSAQAKQSLLATYGGDKERAKAAWGDRGETPIEPDDLNALLDAAEAEMGAPFGEAS